jgi:hypothetical protein
VIHGKRVVLRHIAEHGITSSSDPDGVLSLHTFGVYMMIFLKGLFILRFSYPYPGLDDTRERGGIESFAGTDGDYGSDELMDISLTRRNSVCDIYQRVPFISDPRVEFEDTCSEDLVVIRSVDFL